MGVISTAHSKVVALLTSALSGATYSYIYGKHATANLELASVSIQAVSEAPIETDNALNTNELVDNCFITLSIHIHTGYRNGPTDVDIAMTIVDEIINTLRTNVDLNGGYRTFGVRSINFNVEHTESGTTGAEILIEIHKVEYYAQS